MFASLQLTNSLIAAILALAGIATQKVQGKPNDRASDPPCTQEVEVRNFPSDVNGWSPNGIYKFMDDSHANDGHGVYMNDQVECIWWMDEQGETHWHIGSCDAMWQGGDFYLGPLDPLCPYDGQEGQWVSVGSNEPKSGHVTAIHPPWPVHHHVAHHAHNVAHHVLGAIIGGIGK